MKDEDRSRYSYWQEISSRWADCDAYGHVNNAVYYSWFDTVVTTMLIDRGVLRSTASPSIGLCVESHCEYYEPIEFPETVNLGLRLGKIGSSSLRYEIGLFRHAKETPSATGYFVHVFVDPNTRKSVNLTAEQKGAVADLVLHPTLFN